MARRPVSVGCGISGQWKGIRVKTALRMGWLLGWGLREVNVAWR